MDSKTTVQTIRIIRRGQVVSLPNVSPTRTLLQVLREDLGATSAKEGCNEGDCGACTVVLGEARGGKVCYSAVNSCIRLAHSIDGLGVWTAQDITADDGTLHPAQAAMVQAHGSQCGFCTPGFVMSLFATYQNRVRQGQVVTRELAQEDLSGNLCRCTGYRPIVQAAQAMAALPAQTVDEIALLPMLHSLEQTNEQIRGQSHYFLPKSLKELLTLRANHPNAQIVAGCTDVGLWINKLHMNFAQVLDTTRVAELRRVEGYPHHTAIGAAVNLNDAYAALVQQRPQLQAFAHRFAGLPVRNSGTLGGNIANGSPIGDSMPLLIALNANIVLMSLRGHREMRLEDFYVGYRKNVLAADEVLAWIKVPKPSPREFSRVYKISKRFEDDISAICLAINLELADGRVVRASVGVGGVAATPVRAAKTEASLAGQSWNPATIARAQAALRAEFSPISDMRASAAYRTQVLGNLVQRFWLESQGVTQINLESIDVVALCTGGTAPATAPHGEPS